MAENRRGKNRPGAGYVTLSARIPDDVRLAFRIACLENGATVNDTIEMLARAYAGGRLACAIDKPAAPPIGISAEDVQALVAQDFERIRNDLGMSQRAISEAAGLNPSAWNRYEKDRAPDYEAAMKIAAYLNEKGVKLSPR